PQLPPPPPLPRWALVTLAVAYFRDGPTSSACISMTVRFSPSGLSHERDTRRPVTTTRVPRVSDSATFSAASRQMEHRMNSVSWSFHSLVCRSNVRGVEATVKFATAAPEGVNRSSGSAVRLPTMVIGVSPAMSESFALASRSGADPHQLGAQNGLVQAQLTVQLLCGGRRCGEVSHRVDALRLRLDLVGQATPSPDVQVVDGATFLGDHSEQLLQRRLEVPLVGLRIKDDHEFVLTHA